MASINRVVLVGNLTKDPELRHTPSGTAVCNLRLAVNTRRKDETGQWVDKPNYFDITVWGNQGVADSVQFLGGRGDGDGGGGGGGYIPADTPATPAGDFPSSPTDDDIPF
jgi:single-strand DNA-binding protein